MSECRCACAIHKHFATVVCGRTAQRTIVITGRVASAREVRMCGPCAQWWEESQHGLPPPSTRRVPTFSPTLLFKAVETVAKARGLTYRDIARESGIGSINTITRIKQGGSPDAHTLARLLAWLGSTDLAPYLHYRERT